LNANPQHDSTRETGRSPRHYIIRIRIGTIADAVLQYSLFPKVNRWPKHASTLRASSRRLPIRRAQTNKGGTAVRLDRKVVGGFGGPPRHTTLHPGGPGDGDPREPVPWPCASRTSAGGSLRSTQLNPSYSLVTLRSQPRLSCTDLSVWTSSDVRSFRK
jgi:hypothetical protein